MSWKTRCPICGKDIEFDETGRHYHVNCGCQKEYCETIDAPVCLKHHGECKKCYRREDDYSYCLFESHGVSRLCDKYYDEYCVEEGFLYLSEDNLCENGSLCSSFYFHPVWHKVIHCPYCGSFDVDETDEKNVWILHCNDCDKTFNLKKTKDQKNIEQNNKTRKSELERKITLEERRVKLLKEYKELYDNGVIDEDEYQQKRNELLSSMKLK